MKAYVGAIIINVDLKGDDYMKDLIVITSSIDEIKNLDADSFLIGNKYGFVQIEFFQKKKR